MTLYEMYVPPIPEKKPRGRKWLVGAIVAVVALAGLGLARGCSSVLGVANPLSGRCGLRGDQMSGTLTSAPAATWSIVGNAAAPSVKGHGPGKVEDDGYRSCYARTPTGAVVATANYMTIASHAPIRKKFVEQAILPSPGRDVLLKDPATTASDDGKTPAEIVGFRVVRYDGQQSQVDLALRFMTMDRIALGSITLTLQWSDGDWRIRVPDNGDELGPFSLRASLVGYVPWSGAGGG